MHCALSFGEADFKLPSSLTTIEESAFEGMTAMAVVDARNVSSIAANAFKGCTGLTQIRLSAHCTIDPSTFTGCGTIYVFAPGGDSTETFCQNQSTGFVFVDEPLTEQN